MAFTLEDAKFPPKLLCPNCRLPLQLDDRTLACENRHRFDIAKEGYVNLLRLKKMPKHLGDTKAMFQARRAFLETGHYQPLAELISNSASMALMNEFPSSASTKIPSVLDIGCGEGYYLRQLASRLEEQNIDASYLGMDIAKDGPRMAAKRLPKAHFFVADVNQPLLLPDSTVDLILNIFAPRNPTEFTRVLSSDGTMLIVIPSTEHLATLRAKFGLLDIQADKENLLRAQMEHAGFCLRQTESCTFPMRLSPNEVRSLIEMTPSRHHLTNEKLDELDSLPITTEVTASFRLMNFTK